MSRLDNGVEYACNDFNGFCRKGGIKRELTKLYNPQQNGVIEGKNRSIIGLVKAMIHDHGLYMFLWVEACDTTIHIQNKSHHRVLEDETPEEAFTDAKPEVSHFHIFGCLVYTHVPIDKMTKLEPSCMKGMFVGYSESQGLQGLQDFYSSTEENNGDQGCEV